MRTHAGNGDAWHREVLARAMAMGDEGRWEDMATLLRESLAEEPDDPYLLGWLGVAEQELGDDERARERFRRCLAQDPMDPQLLALAGSALAAWDEPEAEVALRAAALSGPDVAVARLQYGAYLARRGLLGEAMEHLEAALALDPEDPVARAEVGGAHALAGRWDAAAEAMEDALDEAPEDEWTRVLLGLVHLERGDAEAAADALVEGSRGAAEDLEAQSLAALAAAAVGREQQAQEALYRAEAAAGSGDAALLAELEEAIGAGAERAGQLLRRELAPVALRDRLTAPL
jgi:tetratricopeptide (TPR) repeat protein